MQNAYVESFNGKFRDECLAVWRVDYNQTRPHSSLEYRHPHNPRDVPLPRPADWNELPRPLPRRKMSL